DGVTTMGQPLTACGVDPLLSPLQVETNIYYSDDIPNYSIEYNVLTNSPPFKKQIGNLQNYKGFGGGLDLPGTSAAADRFVRGAFYLKSLPKPANQREAIAGVLSVMRSTAQPFRVPEGAPYASSTRWRTVAALTEKLYLYESSLYPTLIWLDAKKLDFKEGSGVRVFDLTKNRQAIGDVSKELKPAKDLFGNNVSE
uniref:linear amide C-N hydrolase n=1 Tax=Argonema antarcticum TaxID=2942763 RepID=UPI002011472E